ncbi:MAG: hypothetical protein MZW92_18430 [Comamonadaceae bacterium]|nr:hypothetical protein [Comamonadaceae bacterium]
MRVIAGAAARCRPGERRSCCSSSTRRPGPTAEAQAYLRRAEDALQGRDRRPPAAGSAPPAR